MLMLYINGTKFNIKIKLAKTFLQKALGLMFKKHFDYCLIFYLEPQAQLRNSIHMLFVFTPILAVFLDKNKKVVDKKVLKPFYLHYTPRKPSTYLLEMPIKFDLKVKLGQKINWKEKN